ncbi:MULTISPECIES: DUF2891 domain-containing protein [Chromobacterium]|uniref:DUF2891 domain-containing protein n=1 Tax=Chromobacterium TaxID=535 RepID=UPI0018899E15|nr:MULTISPECIES: DUF2891 domain-containing protein [Chromobacterium]QOZ84570.1 DUF2891 domain-containing protein [Chromobacterium sp. Rain0013]WON84752.1 DUF2891 domain-containing protein [Chromobacterium haemolyticum]
MNPQQASALAALPLAGLVREYPNFLSHLLNGPDDARTPRSLHPVFYGCYDWHSAVHGFWLLARLARRFPRLPEQADIAALFASHFSPQAFQAEADYFAAPGRTSYERPYGWAWLLALAQELEAWEAPQSGQWREAMRPLLTLIRQRWLTFLPLQDYPIRSGGHANTAFALLLSLDYARAADDAELAQALEAAARRYFLSDADYPARLEPNGDDFLSPCLCQALLLSRLLLAEPFRDWLRAFLPDLPRNAVLLSPVKVSNGSDPKIGHLIGLNLSRAWCLRQLTAALPADDAWGALLGQSARAHLDAGLPHVVSGHYTGEHWLGTFALLALDEGELE